MKTFTLYGSEEVKKVIREFFKSNHEEIVNLQDQKELNASSTPKQTVNTVVRRIKSVFSDTDRYTNTSYRNENYHNMAGKVLRVAVLKVSRIDLLFMISRTLVYIVIYNIAFGFSYGCEI